MSEECEWCCKVSTSVEPVAWQLPGAGPSADYAAKLCAECRSSVIEALGRAYQEKRQ